jgi:D-alanyl-D-alanine carboxypeptidase
VAANAHEHGFIVRYPQGAEHITGCTYEPWNLRYVGPGLMQDMNPEPPSSLFPASEQCFGLGDAPDCLAD